MTATTYVEPLTPIRDWLRGLDDDLAANVYVTNVGTIPTDAYVGRDDANDLTRATIGIARVGGGVDTPFDRPLVQFDCRVPKTGPATAAGMLAGRLCTILDGPGLYGPVPMTGLWLLAADVQSNLPFPDRFPRHVVTADVTVQAR
jgi:hypothetical protein